MQPKLILAFIFLGICPAFAQGLQIAPVSITVPAPGAASSLTLTNTGAGPINIQSRLFSWRQNGEDVLERTDAAVVSPPFVQLKPNGQAVIRIVRLSNAPIVGEEAYRLLIDQIPSNVAPGGNTVQVSLRYSVPVFFTSAGRSPIQINMSARRQGGNLVVTATNQGTTHLRLSSMRATDAAGRTVSFGDGLNGYVLSGATNSFFSKVTATLKGSEVTISANTNLGPLTTVAQLK